MLNPAIDMGMGSSLAPRPRATATIAPHGPEGNCMGKTLLLLGRAT